MQEHDEIMVRLNEDMYKTFLEDGGAALAKLEEKAGIQSSRRRYYDTTRVFIYDEIVR